MPTHFPFPSTAVTVPQLRTAAKAWAKENKTLPAKDVEAIITTLVSDPNAMKKCMAGILLGYLPAQRQTLDPSLYETWLDHTVGWAAVDAICYANFTAEEILAGFPAWQALLLRLMKSENPNKRRGAMVLLTKPLTRSADKHLSRLAFQLIDQAKHEKDILITKAISWLLRSMVKNHRTQLEAYIQKNKTTLPAIALRETGNKLLTGKKTPKKVSPPTKKKMS